MTTSSTNTSPALFEPCTVGAWRLPNRVVMAPLTRNRSPGGVPAPRVAAYYAQRASAGLLISEATAITQQGQGYADVPGLYTPAQLAGWRAVTDAVHAAGGRIVCQLWHVGRISHVALQPGGRDPVAPSALAAKAKTVLLKDDGTAEFVPVSPPRALSRAEIPGIVADYARAATAAVAAGFDGVEIHGANGYLIDQFLKTGSNHRDDDYGGPIPHRARFALEVAQAVAAAIGGERTGIRVSPVTPANDADTEDTQPLFEHLLRGLAPLGLAYVHVIEGSTGGPRELPERPFDYAALRQTYRDAGGTGAWMVNNGYDRALADAALAQGADLVAFGRPFISNPDLVRRLRDGLPWAEPDRKTFYGGGDAGYIDYPAAP
ncbi:alkene reductase [Rubrivivax albus]|uniref:Alkene reductase n=1 Tax=Rubrivivax albus TaxID=2499835 RepID=A0A3S2TNR4_9BURK|nr:alkene reductase [Rubrivivax albus]RVT52535.1 alkene reductase [Rubrivivax albus]